MTKASSKTTSKASAAKAKPTVAKGGIASKKGGVSSSDTILSTLATLYQRGNKSPDKKLVESLCAKAMAKKTFMNTITKLKEKELVVATTNTFALTETAMDEMGDDMFSTGVTNEEVHEKLLEKLKGKKVAMFKLLADGNVHNKEDVARELKFKEGKKQKGFQNLIAEMKNKEHLVEYPSADTVQLIKAICFPYDEATADSWKKGCIA